MKMDFKAGDRVVCVRESPGRNFLKGHVYTVTDDPEYGTGVMAETQDCIFHFKFLNQNDLYLFKLLGGGENGHS